MIWRDWVFRDSKDALDERSNEKAGDRPIGTRIFPPFFPFPPPPLFSTHPSYFRFRCLLRKLFPCFSDQKEKKKEKNPRTTSYITGDWKSLTGDWSQAIISTSFPRQRPLEHTFYIIYLSWIIPCLFTMLNTWKKNFSELEMKISWLQILSKSNENFTLIQKLKDDCKY